MIASCPARKKRRRVARLLLPLAGILAAVLVFQRLGGTFRHEPEELWSRLTPEASNLVMRAFADLEGPPVDYHAHRIGAGTDGSGTELEPAMLAGWNPVKRLKAALFLGACGVTDKAQLDGQYNARLLRLAKGFPVPLRVHLLALDRRYGADGKPIPGAVEFHVPNGAVAEQAERHPETFTAVVSIHPDRPDAVDELEAWAARGARYVKWLPNAQGMDPGSPRHDPFYDAMRRHGMVLLTHGGLERSVGSGAQAFGNPLLLRRPLDRGVKVIVAHAACTGWNEDLDRPGVKAKNFDLFLRLMGEEKYKGLLFADISAMTQVNRAPGPILELIRRPEWHGRLVNGSDYPLPALNCMIWTRQLAWKGLITAEERRALNAVYDCNPLLFDFVLKRTVRDPQTGNRLPARVFARHPELP